MYNGVIYRIKDTKMTYQNKLNPLEKLILDSENNIKHMDEVHRLKSQNKAVLHDQQLANDRLNSDFYQLKRRFDDLQRDFNNLKAKNELLLPAEKELTLMHLEFKGARELLMEYATKEGKSVDEVDLLISKTALKALNNELNEKNGNNLNQSNSNYLVENKKVATKLEDRLSFAKDLLESFDPVKLREKNEEKEAKEKEELRIKLERQEKARKEKLEKEYFEKASNELLESVSVVNVLAKNTELESVLEIAKKEGYPWVSPISAINQCKFELFSTNKREVGGYFKKETKVDCYLKVTNLSSEAINLKIKKVDLPGFNEKVSPVLVSPGKEELLPLATLSEGVTIPDLELELDGKYQVSLVLGGVFKS